MGGGCFPGGSAIKNPLGNAGDARDAGPIPGSGRSPGEGNGYPLQYSCLENSTDREAYSPWDHKESDTTVTEHTSQPWGKALEFSLLTRIKSSLLLIINLVVVYD